MKVIQIHDSTMRESQNRKRTPHSTWLMYPSAFLRIFLLQGCLRASPILAPCPPPFSFPSCRLLFFLPLTLLNLAKLKKEDNTTSMLCRQLPFQLWRPHESGSWYPECRRVIGLWKYLSLEGSIKGSQLFLCLFFAYFPLLTSPFAHSLAGLLTFSQQQPQKINTWNEKLHTKMLRSRFTCSGAKLYTGKSSC